jgi:hypothetical protein
MIKLHNPIHSQQIPFWRKALDPNDLKLIAEELFHMRPEGGFKSKDAFDIEVALQAMINQLVAVPLQDFILQDFILQDFILPFGVDQIHSEVGAGSRE